MRSSGKSSLMAAAALAAAFAGLGTVANQAGDSLRGFRAAAGRVNIAGHAAGMSLSLAELNRVRALFSGGATRGMRYSSGLGGVHGPAGTNRRYQRAMQKRRNVARNRRAHRG